MTRPHEFEPAQAYTLDLPRSPRPIVVIGAGGIVRDAHLPAYRKAGFPVHSICDRDEERAAALAHSFGIPAAWSSIDQAVADAPADAVFDVALTPDQFEVALTALPDGAAVLIQKPLGTSLDEARRLVEICQRKGLIAAVNTQLRFAPQIAAARAVIAAGAIGELIDLEIRVSVRTPWEMFPFVSGLERLELTMHSVHYLDLIRSFLGDPTGVSAVTVGHPDKPLLATTRSLIVLHYAGRPIRVGVSTNHDHDFGARFEESFVKWEGTGGAVRVQLGLLLDYPTGSTDTADIIVRDSATTWSPLPFEGSWFPDAFIGSMGALQRYLEGSIPTLPTSVDDVIHTMAIVEAADEASALGGTVPRYPHLDHAPLGAA